MKENARTMGRYLGLTVDFHYVKSAAVKSDRFRVL